MTSRSQLESTPVFPEGLEMIRPLGDGKMARVFLARETDLQRVVAVNGSTLRTNESGPACTTYVAPDHGASPIETVVRSPAATSPGPRPSSGRPSRPTGPPSVTPG